MKYAITLDPSIARRHVWTGTRRRECTFADGSKKTLVFSRQPIELDELPPEIVADSMLIVKVLTEPDRAFEAGDYDDGILELPEASAAPSTEKKGDRVQKSKAHKGQK